MRKLSLVLGIVMSTWLSADIWAAGSGLIRLELPDAAAVGKGSAFVGQANRPSAVYYNPAGIVQIGREMSLGVTAIGPRLDYKSTVGEEIQMRRDAFVFPHAYMTIPIVQDKFYVGIGESSNWGLGSSWAPDALSGFNRYSCYKSEFENKDYMLVGAYKLDDQWSFAVGADNDDSRLDKEKKLMQVTKNDGNLQMKARDNAWGFRLASMYKINSRHQFGLMYRSPIQHTYEGKAYLDDLANGIAGTDYQTIFGGTSYETGVATKFTLPQSLVMGYSFTPTNKWTFNVDMEWLDWSAVEEQTYDWKDETNATRLGVLNTGTPQSRDWKSVWSGSFGSEYAATEKLRVRGGYVYHQTPVGNDTFDTVFFDSNSHSFTTGFGCDITDRMTVDFAYAGVLYEARKVENSLDSVFGADLDGKYREFVNIGTVTLNYKF